MAEVSMTSNVVEEFRTILLYIKNPQFQATKVSFTPRKKKKKNLKILAGRPLICKISRCEQNVHDEFVASK